MKKIAIIGAAGYVGKELVKNLDDNKSELVGITHHNGKFLLKSYNIDIKTPEQISSHEHFDIIVNFAYPNRGPALEYSQANDEIFGIINLLTTPETKIIHCSTQAVFGYALEFPVHDHKIKNRADHPYITSKIFMENRLIEKYSENELHIIRLGNVWGPGSPAWTANLINRLEFADVIGINSIDGYSNLTDVANIISYIQFLLHRDYSREIHFHHLAEFSEYRWSHWINLLANELNVEPVYLDYEIPKEGLLNELVNQFSIFSPIKISKTLMRNRFSGSYMRKLLSVLPDNRLKILEDRTMPAGFSPNYFDIGLINSFLTIMSCTKQFKNVVAKEWYPPVDAEESWRRVFEWMRTSNYF